VIGTLGHKGEESDFLKRGVLEQLNLEYYLKLKKENRESRLLKVIFLLIFLFYRHFFSVKRSTFEILANSAESIYLWD
jgi:hypothetical protein